MNDFNIDNNKIKNNNNNSEEKVRKKTISFKPNKVDFKLEKDKQKVDPKNSIKSSNKLLEIDDNNKYNNDYKSKRASAKIPKKTEENNQKIYDKNNEKHLKTKSQKKLNIIYNTPKNSSKNNNEDENQLNEDYPFYKNKNKNKNKDLKNKKSLKNKEIINKNIKKNSDKNSIKDDDKTTRNNFCHSTKRADINNISTSQIIKKGKIDKKDSYSSLKDKPFDSNKNKNRSSRYLNALNEYNDSNKNVNKKNNILNRSVIYRKNNKNSSNNKNKKVKEKVKIKESDKDIKPRIRYLKYSSKSNKLLPQYLDVQEKKEKDEIKNNSNKRNKISFYPKGNSNKSRKTIK